MKKFLLLLIASILMPVFASAANQVLQKTRPSSYPMSSPSDYRLVIPYEALGNGSLGSSGMSSNESYTFGMWIKVTDVVSAGNTYSSNGGIIASFGTLNHMNYNGNWVFMTKADGTVTIGGHGVNDHGAGVGFSNTTVKT
ncbi:MAG: hypothetical protein K2H74_01310, partial [Paramuribaculum sp.]|nr:hypothetical protein [Paramuribaculum sp.]